MLSYTIQDMTCGHCVKRITGAIQTLVPDARVEADLPSHTLRVDTNASDTLVRGAIQDAGYTALPAG